MQLQNINSAKPFQIAIVAIRNLPPSEKKFALLAILSLAFFPHSSHDDSSEEEHQMIACIWYIAENTSHVSDMPHSLSTLWNKTT